LNRVSFVPLIFVHFLECQHLFVLTGYTRIHHISNFITFALTACWFAIRVTRLAEFSPIGRLFFKSARFWSHRYSPNFGLLFPRLLTNLDKKWVGLHFGRFFIKLIWSPCSQYRIESRFPIERKNRFDFISKLFFVWKIQCCKLESNPLPF
jgi:hypothetical protein